MTQYSRVIFTRYTGNPNLRTPKALYDELDKEFHFTFDPCPLNETPLFNGLEMKWNGSVYVNPPYSEPKKWIVKALWEINSNPLCKVVVMLLKADVSTKWFHDFVVPNAKEIRAIKGRLKFDNKNPAPFPSMVVIF